MLSPAWTSTLAKSRAGCPLVDDRRLLGCCNLLGTTYEASTIATGFGAHLAQPLLREAVEGREDVLAEAEAQSILEKCMTVLWYRDARSTDKVMGAQIDVDPVDSTGKGDCTRRDHFGAVPGAQRLVRGKVPIQLIHSGERAE